jgi:protein O-GlcNAc transferase
MSGRQQQALLELALRAHRHGDLAAAARIYADILREYPRCFDALHLLGIARADAGRLDEGAELLRRAIAVDAGRPDAHYHLARALMRKGDAAAALGCLERATGLEPAHADAWYLRGIVLQEHDRLEQCAESYRHAIAGRPAFPEAFNNLAAALRSLRRLAEARECADRALDLRPAYAKALNNRGLISLDQRRASAAVDDFCAAVAHEPQFAEALHNLGTALMLLRRFAEARDAFAKVVALAPGLAHVQGQLLYAKLSCCDWSDFDASVSRVTAAIARGERAIVPMSFLCVCGSAAAQLRCAQQYTATYYPQCVPVAAPRRARRDRIRVAYLSGDFGAHPVTYLLAGVLERHDRARFETIALAWDRKAEGPARRRVEAAVSQFIDVTYSSDEEVARLMHRLEVDIAVDLCGHTLGQRTGIFARRAAPLQVNYLGLPATMGAPYMDYLIADRFLVPDAARMHYAECIVWLDGAFQPNDDRRHLAPDRASRGAHGLPAAGPVFCSFNRPAKLNPQCFDVWMRMLATAPGSVFWLLATTAEAERNLRREAAERGVDPDRLVFAGEVSYEEYLARYRHADLFVDSVPFNGGTTVSDALSMGVPVLTCAGDAFAARMAGSLLTHLDLGELVTSSMQEYERAALDLAADPMRIGRLRRQLEELRSSHSLFDTDRYRRQLEGAYLAMYERHVAGQGPEAFAVRLDT